MDPKKVSAVLEGYIAGKGMKMPALIRDMNRVLAMDLSEYAVKKFCTGTGSGDVRDYNALISFFKARGENVLAGQLYQIAVDSIVKPTF